MIAGSTLMTFWVLAVLLTLLLSLVAISPWLYRPRQRGNLLNLNVAVFRERLAELDADHQQGKLEEDDYQGQKVDLERQLLAAQDSEVAHPLLRQGFRQSTQFKGNVLKSSDWVRPPVFAIVLVFLWIPILTIGAYQVWADRQQTAMPQFEHQFAHQSGHQALLAYWQAQDQYAGTAEQLMTGKIQTPPDDALKSGLAFLQALQANAYAHPLDAARWAVLSRVYVAADLSEPALAALAHAYRLAPHDAETAMAYAQLRFVSQQGKLDDTTYQIVQQILAQDPKHEGAMMLMAAATYRNQQYAEAIVWLNRLKNARLARAAKGQAVDPAVIAQLDQAISAAEQANAQMAQNSVNATLEIRLQLADRIRAQIGGNESLFVYVRALQGVAVPYAVQKLPVKALLDATQQHADLTVSLSDADSMMPERTISAARRAGVALVVSARISKSGNPVGASGDFESLPVPLDDGSQYVVDIDQIQP